VACAYLHSVRLSDEDFRGWVRLDTFDMYSPAHDHPSDLPRSAPGSIRRGSKSTRAIRTGPFPSPALDYAKVVSRPKNSSAQTSNATIAWSLRAKFRRPLRCSWTVSAIDSGFKRPRNRMRFGFV